MLVKCGKLYYCLQDHWAELQSSQQGWPRQEAELLSKQPRPPASSNDGYEALPEVPVNLGHL